MQLEARFDRVEAMVAGAAAATADRVMAALAQAGGGSGARGAGGLDPLLRAAAVAEALDTRLRHTHLQWGRSLPPVFGLRLPDLADVPPAELALWWVEEAAAESGAAAAGARSGGGGSDAPVMQVAGRAESGAPPGSWTRPCTPRGLGWRCTASVAAASSASATPGLRRARGSSAR